MRKRNVSRPPKKTVIPIVLIQTEWGTERDRGASASVRAWAEAALKRLLKLKSRYFIISLFGKKAVRTHVERELSKIKNKKGLVVFYGRGCSCGESLFETQLGPDVPWFPLLSAINVNLLNNKIVYAVACHSAKTIGPYAVKTNTISYIGYLDSISAGVANQAVLRGFEEAANIGLRVLTESNGTCREARDEIYRTYDEWIQSCLDKRDVLNALALINGRDALVPRPLGDENARLT
jgi:hypothetical protein